MNDEKELDYPDDNSAATIYRFGAGLAGYR
jgi:hypothetical protein